MADMDYVSSMSQGFQPMVGSGGVRPQLPYEGIPGLGSTVGQMIAPLAMPAINAGMTAHGYRPYGNTDQNLLDRNRGLAMSNSHRKLTAASAKEEQAAWMESMAQLWKRTRKEGESQELTPEVIEQHRRIAELGTYAAPALAATEFGRDALDFLSGGNSAVNMQHNMLQGGQYRLDPATGRFGMSDESMQAAHKQLFQEYYGGKPGEWRDKTKGFTARQMGEMFTTLQSRGMIESGDRENTAIAALTSGKVDVEGALKHAKIDPATIRGKDGTLDIGKLSDSQLSEVSQAPEMEQMMRSLDVEKVKKATDKYKGVLSAMRDIFGDAGHKNVPIQELVNAIEAFTGGATAQLDPGRLEMMVRTTHQVAKQAGVSMDQMMTMQQGFGQRAQQLGLDPVFASFATQRAAAGMGAFSDAGLGAHAAWGKLNASQYGQAVGNMQLSANKSEIGNVVGAAMRIEESLGKDAIKPGTKSAAYLAAVKAGETSFVDPTTGKKRWVGDLKAGEFGQMIAADAKASDGTPLMTADQAAAMVNDKHSNMGAIATQGDPSYVARMQGEGIRRRVVAPGMASAFRSMFSQDAAGEAKTLSVAETMSKTFLSMTQAQSSNREERTKVFRETLMAEHPELMAQLTGTEEEKQIKLNSMIEAAYSEANARMVRDPHNGGMNMQSYKQLNDPRAQQYMKQRQEQARVRGMLGSEVAGIATGSGANKLIEALREGKPLDAMLLTMAGGLQEDELRERFGDSLKKLDEIKTGPGGLKELSEAQDKDISTKKALDKEEDRMALEMSKAKTPEEKAALKEKHAARQAEISKERQAIDAQMGTRQKQIEEKTKVYDDVSGQIRDEFEASGISTTAPETEEKLVEAADKFTDAVSEFGKTVTDMRDPKTTVTASKAVTEAKSVTAVAAAATPAAKAAEGGEKTKAEAAMESATAAATPAQPQNITITGKLVVSSDGTGTLTAQGPASRHGVPVPATV